MAADVVSLLQELIRIPSVNPDNAPGTDEIGEQALAEFLAGWLAEIGANVTLDTIKPNRPNLIARFGERDGRRRILFGPHLDTVGVSGMVIDPFGGEVREGCVWGRGASDTKGPMAAMLWALREVSERLQNPPIGVDFVAFMGEESGQWGSKQFAATYAHEYDFAIVGEPTSMQVVHATKGSLWATLRATGKAAHSSQPAMGENAIMKLVRALGQLEPKLTEALGAYTHPLLGQSTLNVGVVRGGSRPNVIPDLAEAEIDIRVTPALAKAGGATKLLKEIIASLGLPLEIAELHENLPMETDPELPYIRALRETDPAVGLAGAPWFSDAGHLSSGGIPSICIGPGSIDQAHTVDEFIKIAALEEGAVIFSRFLGKLLGERLLS